MQLRDYQIECVNAIDNMQSGSGLVVMATGLGKTVVFSHIKRKGRVLIISHREELVRQPIKFYDCQCGVEQGGEVSHGEEVVSASVQSLIGRLGKFSPTEFDMIITDEAHHAAAPSYKKIYSYFKPRIHVGFTATPNRGDKVRLDDVFDGFIFKRDLKWGIVNDWLTNIKCLRVKVGFNLSGVRCRMGDFIVGELDKQVNNDVANEQIAEIYAKYAQGQTLIFAASVEHAENIASLIDGAVVVSQKTKNRKQIIDDFTSRKIKCIVNCMIFTEGTDLPLIETIIIARPTKNASLYTQMVGRGLRKAEGKKYLTLIDCVGVSGSLDICTAPTLMGLDASAVPERRQDMIQGMLTDMHKTIEKAMDCPENWVYNVEAVRLFAKDENVDIHSINWTKKSNGDLVYQFTDGNKIGIRAIDELGKTCVMYYFYDEKKGDFRYYTSPEMDLQSALDRAYSEFVEDYESERSFWDIREYSKWQYERATEKQKSYIKSKLTEEEWEQLIKKTNTGGEFLSKGQAAQVITNLKVRGVSPQALRANYLRKLHEREEEENFRANREIQIEHYLFASGNKKYYALDLYSQLIVTNSWDNASRLIEEAKAQGRKVRFKGFATVAEADEFLKS